jgi:predicted RNA-binding protein (virulence factor B family)
MLNFAGYSEINQPMLAGIRHKLTVGRVSDHGLYLTDGEGTEVLLPNRYVSLENHVGDVLDVFVYHDSEDRLIATTDEPLGKVGEVAFLRVVGKTDHGAFLDWGVTAKDLFLPNRNMVGYVEVGKSYVVYIYRDSVTGRTVASMALRGFLANDSLTLRRGQEVSLTVTQRMERGWRVAIDNRWWGMIYDNQIFGQAVTLGARLRGFVRRVGDDNRVDVSLQQEGYDEVKAQADRLIEMLRGAGGRLALHDGSDPAEVVAATGMSKKVFKRTVGHLMKRGDVAMDGEGITLKSI